MSNIKVNIDGAIINNAPAIKKKIRFIWRFRITNKILNKYVYIRKENSVVDESRFCKIEIPYIIRYNGVKVHKTHKQYVKLECIISSISWIFLKS